MVIITVFSVIATQPTLKLQEKHPPACELVSADETQLLLTLFMTGLQSGWQRVEEAVQNHLQETLKNAGVSAEDVVQYTTRGIQSFAKIRRSFRDASVNCSLEIAGTRLNDKSIGIRRGRMPLLG